MKKYGLLGRHLTHSKSPEIHQVIFDTLNIDAHYTLEAIEAGEIPKKINQYDGLNVTMPYKEVVIKHLETLTDEAKSIGAVNTIYNNTGYNTDVHGFGKLLKYKNFDIQDKIAVILGTGGASKAVDYYLRHHGIKKIIYVSRSKTGENVINYQDVKEVSGDLLINTTPVGMYPDTGKSPVSEEIIQRFHGAIDLIYNPLETEFLRLAKKNGLKTSHGLWMLIGQAIKAEEIWQNQGISDDIFGKIKKVFEK